MAAQTVAELTIDEFRALIRETVTEVVAELLDDPDEGLELTDWAAARLQAARKAAEGQRPTKPLSEVARRHGLSA
jgi:CRP-like cAMP-binding protein